MIHTELIKQQEEEDNTFPKLMYMEDRNTILLVINLLSSRKGCEYMGTILKTDSTNLRVGEVIAAKVKHFTPCNEQLVLSNRPIEKIIIS